MHKTDDFKTRFLHKTDDFATTFDGFSEQMTDAEHTTRRDGRYRKAHMGKGKPGGQEGGGITKNYLAGPFVVSPLFGMTQNLSSG